MEDWTRRQDAARQRRSQGQRRRRLVLGLLASLVLAAAVGYILGRSAHQTAADIARDAESGGGFVSSELKRERQRVIQELWRMEIWEHSGAGRD